MNVKINNSDQLAIFGVDAHCTQLTCSKLTDVSWLFVKHIPVRRGGKWQIIAQVDLSDGALSFGLFGGLLKLFFGLGLIVRPSKEWLF